VQDAAFDVVLNVDPATHEVQPVFVVTVQLALLRVPAAHILHVVHTLFVVAVHAPV
jgi:hypothetical protein